ncbi:MAG: MBL fold metallo-hydrolase [Bacteroidales bacterium]|nr:MBL fold metallo-hydrolase [Bacteroidales bacterium]
MIGFARKVKKTPIGKLNLFSVGQAGFIIKSKSGKLLGIDLYLSDFSERDEGHIGFKRMLPKILGTKEVVFDYLIATHEHSDHYDYDSMKDLMENGHTELFASVDCERLSVLLGIDSNRVRYVKPGDSFYRDGFSFFFINCDHGIGAPDAVGIIVEVDGKRIVEVGDTCLRLDRKEEYLSRGSIDVLIAPINGAYGNLNEDDCAKLSELLSPKLTIPCHYGMFASHFGLPGLFMKHMKSYCPNNAYLIMTQGESIEL